MPEENGSKKISGRSIIVFVLGLGYIGMYDILAVFNGEISSYDGELWHRVGIVVILSLLFFQPTKFDKFAEQFLDRLPIIGKGNSK